MTDFNYAPQPIAERNPEAVAQLLSNSVDQSFSFVELVLYATEFSEDETEVADLVDAMFDSELFPLSHDCEDLVALA